MAHNSQHVEAHHAGDAHVLPVSVTDGDGEEIDITGAEIEWFLKRERGAPDADALLSKTAGSGVEVINAGAGEAEIQIETGDTDGLLEEGTQEDSFEHVCRITIDGDRVTVFHGSFQVVRW